jgi:hypothetical protein
MKNKKLLVGAAIALVLVLSLSAFVCRPKPNMQFQEGACYDTNLELFRATVENMGAGGQVWFYYFVFGGPIGMEPVGYVPAGMSMEYYFAAGIYTFTPGDYPDNSIWLDRKWIPDCTNPSPANPLLWMATVYSESGFYTNPDGGVVNTCSLFYDRERLGARQPSKDRVVFWCTQWPEDAHWICNQPLYDDGDGGVWACDSKLAEVGERRAKLRDDPEGPSMDLLPKIEKYEQQLTELGY